jgi:hypothetical protein
MAKMWNRCATKGEDWLIDFFATEGIDIFKLHVVCFYIEMNICMVFDDSSIMPYYVVTALLESVESWAVQNAQKYFLIILPHKERRN